MVHCYSDVALRFRRERVFARGFLSPRYKHSHHIQTKHLLSNSQIQDITDVLATDDPWSTTRHSKVNTVFPREGMSIEKLAHNPWAEFNLRRGLAILPVMESSGSSSTGPLHVPETQLPFDSLHAILTKLAKIEMLLVAGLSK